jgi:uncharacterized membrane protein
VLLAISLASLQATFAERRTPSSVLASLAGVGVLFTAYLTYLELFVIHAICRWCVASGVVILLIFIVSLLDLRRLSRTRYR